MLETGNAETFCLFKKLIPKTYSLHCFSKVICPGCKPCQLWACRSSVDCLTMPEQKRDLHNTRSEDAQRSSCPPWEAPCTLLGSCTYETSTSRWPFCWTDLHAVGRVFVLFWCLCPWRLCMLYTPILTEFQAHSSPEETSLNNASQHCRVCNIDDQPAGRRSRSPDFI